MKRVANGSGESTMFRDADSTAPAGSGSTRTQEPPLIIATILREEGITGVHTHFRELCRYLEAKGTPAALVTSFSWGRPLTAPVFGVRYLLERCSGSANVWWYRHGHEVFLYRALRRRLAGVDECVIYAQCPVSARAALRARRGPHQRVVMAVHFRVSQADEWTDKDRGAIARGGKVFRDIRSLERTTVAGVDGVVYVSKWGRDALLSWCPEAAAVPSAVIGNFVARPAVDPPPAPAADLVSVGNLEAIKNHRYVLEVLAQAKRLGRSYTIDIFGEGPMRKDLEQLIAVLGLEGQARLRGFRGDVRSRLPGYRACVHASYSESLPLAIIEAMAAGLPVVAADTGGVAELLDDGVEGRFWPLDDPAAAAAILIDLLDDDAKRARAGAAALDRFRRDFDAEVLGPRLLSFVTNTPNRRSEPSGQRTPAPGPAVDP